VEETMSEREGDGWRRLCVREREMGGGDYVGERGRWVEFDNEELHNLYSSSNMMKAI
jgi:hypothetical protein